MADESGRRGVAAGAVAAGVLAAGLVLFVTYGIEWVENEMDIGYAEEARRNPYLAASMFLSAQGVRSESVEGLSLLDDLPYVSDTIVMSTSRRTLSERRLAELGAWVAAGGHLVVAAQEVFDPERGESRDPFLDRLGIRLNAPDPDERRAALAGVDVDHVEDEEPGREEGDEDASRTLEAVLDETFSGQLEECESNEDRLAFMFVDGDPRMLQLELPSRNFLSTEDDRWLEAASSAGAQLVRVPLASGMVTAATSIDIWRNQRIHCGDHAYLLWLLSSGSTKVWMLHDPHAPSLAGVVAANFPLTLAGVGLIFLVWAASATLRFGPYRRVASVERRQLLEHLQATADFLWRGALLHPPLEALREDLAQRATRTSAAGAGTPQGRVRRTVQIVQIAEIAQLPVEDVEFALTGNSLASKRDFVKTMQILGKARRHL